MQKSMINLLSVADTISITNAIFGILAILFLISNLGVYEEFRLRISFSLILLAILADGLDGTIARRFRKSDIGIYLDSMADMTSFVIAPIVFVYFIYSNLPELSFYRHIYLLFALILFLAFGVIRLASFHLMKEDKYFIGLPTPASAIILLIISWFEVGFIFILPTVVIIAALMASNIKFPKLGRKMDLVAAVLIIFSIILYDIYYGIAPFLLLIAIVIYSIGGPIYIKFLTES